MDRPEQGAVLDRRTLNRTLLARQLLLERVDAPAYDVVERLVGMQAQVPLDPYVGLWSRLRGFDPGRFGRLLLERKLVRMTMLRTTLHLVSARDALGVRPLLQTMIERAFASSPFARNLDGLDVGPVLARGVELVEQEPRTTAKLAAALAPEWPEYDPESLAYAVRYLVPLVQVTPRGVWGETLEPRVTTLTSWLGRSPAPVMSLDELVGRYLRAFGPASAADIRAWSGLSDVRSITDRLRPGLHVYRDEAGRELFDVHDGAFCDPSAPAPVRFLPQFDNVFLGHKDRARIVDRVNWGGSFVGQGVVFVDGFLAGSWKLSTRSGEATLRVETRTSVAGGDRRQIRSEAERLLAFMATDARARRIEVDAG